jgi:hypothetical protein
VSGAAGDEESYRAFVTARYTALRRTAYVLTGNHHDAEDLVQTALMEAAGVWRRIEAAGSRRHGGQAGDDQVADQARAHEAPRAGPGPRHTYGEAG